MLLTAGLVIIILEPKKVYITDAYTVGYPEIRVNQHPPRPWRNIPRASHGKDLCENSHESLMGRIYTRHATSIILMRRRNHFADKLHACNTYHGEASCKKAIRGIYPVIYNFIKPPHVYIHLSAIYQTRGSTTVPTVIGYIPTVMFAFHA